MPSLTEFPRPPTSAAQIAQHPLLGNIDLLRSKSYVLVSHPHAPFVAASVRSPVQAVELTCAASPHPSVAG